MMDQAELRTVSHTIAFSIGTFRAVDRCYSLLRALLAGFWLGILDRKRLYHLDEAYYCSQENYYSERYNRRGFFPWEQAVISEYFPKRGRCLLIGAGGGREVLALHRYGLQVDAFECHAGMREFANRLLAADGLDLSVEVAARDSCPKTGQQYDAAVVGWGAYMLIQGKANRLRFLHDLVSQIEPGAPVLLSFYACRKHNRLLRLTYSLARTLRWLRRLPPPDLGDSLGPNFHHFFTEDQIRCEVEEAGLELELYSTWQYGHAVAIRRQASLQSEHRN